MKLRYFAWVRERVGRAEEDIALPDNVTTVGALIAWLKTRGDESGSAFEHETIIRAAIDRVHAKPDASLSGAREVAFFPPMTGG